MKEGLAPALLAGGPLSGADEQGRGHLQAPGDRRAPVSLGAGPGSGPSAPLPSPPAGPHPGFLRGARRAAPRGLPLPALLPLSGAGQLLKFVLRKPEAGETAALRSKGFQKNVRAVPLQKRINTLALRGFLFFNLLGVWLAHGAMFLLHGTVVQLCAYTALLFQVPAHIGHHRVLSRFPVLYNRPLLPIYSMYGFVGTSIPCS